MENPFRYCPSCGKTEQLIFDMEKHLFCKSCGYEYYHNTAAAVACFLEYNGKILVLQRNREPGAGMLDLPGGFVDPMESGEEAICREIKEELAITLTEIKFLFTNPNQYKYKSINYHTLDLFFYAKIISDKFIIDTHEIRSYKFLKPSELKEDDFCFISMKKAIKRFKEGID